METRAFANGVRVSVLGVGCGRVGSINNLVPMREIEATLEAAIAAGVNFFDTANIYGQGDSEKALGRLLARYRDRMFVTTKVGFEVGRHAGVMRIAKPLIRTLIRLRPRARTVVLQARARSVGQNFSRQDLDCAVDGSCRRLGVDQLDGLLLHNPPVEMLRNPDIHDFLGGLVHGGKASQVGVSLESAEEVEAALSIPLITMLQIPWRVASAISGTGIPERILERRIGLFVREILGKPDIERRGLPSIRDALLAAIAPDFVTAAIIGVSTRRHLHDLLSVVS
jgi:aryl-alcohol dehydrogenase-like predicted oxidoreductase